MSGMELFNEHFTRVKAALDLKKPDRTPVVVFSDSFSANHMGYSIAEFCADIELSNKIILDSMKELGDIDGLEFPFCIVELQKLGYPARIKVPGVELPPDQIWQVDEIERLKPEDYDTIIKLGGMEKFLPSFREKHGIVIDMEKVQKIFGFIPQAMMNAVQDGYVLFSSGTMVGHPLDTLVLGRSMSKFMQDLFRMPDKVQETLDVVYEETIAQYKSTIAAMPQLPLTTFIGMARAASVFMSPKFWERFIWPYLKKISEEIIGLGIVPYYHADGDYTRDLPYFKEISKGCFSSDAGTDIFKIKEILGDRMSLRGDVPPALLTLGTPDEVFDYSTRLIREIGPSGFILASGCSIPPNAKVENVKAMVAAANGK